MKAERATLDMREGRSGVDIVHDWLEPEKDVVVAS